MDDLDATASILIALCVILVCLRPKWDPAIRLKEWLSRGGENR